MDKIKQWLNDGGSFEEGVILLGPHCKNPHKMSGILRRHDDEKLRYELQRIVEIYEPKVKAEVVEIPAAGAHPAGELPPKPHERLQVVKDGKVRIDDLPQELREVYQNICDVWKLMQSTHQKMKLVGTDQERAELVASLKEQENAHGAGWAVIDHWAATGEMPASKVTDPSSADEVPDYKAVNSARLQLSRYVKQLATEQDPAKVEELKGKAREKVAIIQAAGGSFNKLDQPLRDLGILN